MGCRLVSVEIHFLTFVMEKTKLAKPCLTSSTYTAKLINMTKVICWWYLRSKTRQRASEWLETETFQFWEEWKSIKTFDQSQIEKANPRYTWYKQPISSSPQRTVFVVTFHTFTLYYPYNLGITDNIKVLAKNQSQQELFKIIKKLTWNPLGLEVPPHKQEITNVPFFH